MNEKASRTTHLMFEWLTSLERDGVAKIEAVFSKKEMDELRCRAWRAFRHASEQAIQWRGLYPALLFGPSGLDSFRRDPRMAEIAKAVLGNDILQLNNQIYFRLPGDGDQFAWHQDITFRAPSNLFEWIEEGYLQTAIVIDDIEEDNGAIEYVLGTHKKGDLGLVARGTEKGLRDFHRGDFKGVKMTAKSGDVLVWSVMVVHGSEPNQSNKARMYYMNGLAKAACVRRPDVFPWYIRDGKVV